MTIRATSIFVLLSLMLISGCGKIQDVREAEPQTNISPKETQLPEDVPDYVRDSDAKMVSRSETDDLVRIEMETINGISSPVGYYRKTLTEGAWDISKDKEEDDGLFTMEAKKNGISLFLTFAPMGGGTKIELIVEK